MLRSMSALFGQMPRTRTRARTRKRQKQQCISRLDSWLLRECGRFLSAHDLRTARCTAELWSKVLVSKREPSGLFFWPTGIATRHDPTVYTSGDVLIGRQAKLACLPVLPRVEVLELGCRFDLRLDDLHEKFPKLKSLHFSEVPLNVLSKTLSLCVHLREVYMPISTSTNLETLLGGSNVQQVEFYIDCFSDELRELRLPRSVQNLKLTTNPRLPQSSPGVTIVSPGLEQFESSYLIFDFCEFSHPENLKTLTLSHERVSNHLAQLHGQMTSLDAIFTRFSRLTDLNLECLHFAVNLTTQCPTIKRVALSLCLFCEIAHDNDAFAELWNSFPAIEHLSVEFSTALCTSAKSPLSTAWLKKLPMLRAIAIHRISRLDGDLAKRLRHDLPRLETLKLSDYRIERPEQFFLPGLRWLKITAIELNLIKETALRTFLQNTPKLEACILAPDWFPPPGSKICDKFPLVRFKN